MTALRVGVVGGSGYTGGELLRLLLGHPAVELTYVTSRKYRGEYIYRLHPNLRGFTAMQFEEFNHDVAASKCDAVFTAVPHGSAVNIVPQLMERGLSIVDLSADFRLKDPADYVTWYGFKHPRPDLLTRFVYGSPELHREAIRSSKHVAGPGCMAITSILGLAPLVKARLIDVSHIVVDAKIGSSGAGVKPDISTHHSERYGVVRPYKAVGHRHTAEIEQELKSLDGDAVKVSLSPHAVNMVRGILCTIHVFAQDMVSAPEVWRSFREAYESEPFIRLIRDRKGLYRYPDPKMVVGSNFCDLGFEVDEHSSRIVVFAAIDNLVKGAAGSAVQCMNLMCGFDERAGLQAPALHPV